MGIRRNIFAWAGASAVLLVAVAASAAEAVGGGPAALVTLYNPQTNTPDGFDKTKVGADEAKKVLAAVFPRFLTDAKQCPSNAGSLDEARRSGAIVPAVRAAADGAFTAAGTRERVYFVFVGECGAPHVANFGSYRLAVFQGGALVAWVDARGDTGVAGPFDIDGDGQSELLLTSTFSAQGSSTTSARLARFRGGLLTEIKHFGDVEKSRCLGPGQEADSFKIIRAASKPGPYTFAIEDHVTPCADAQGAEATAVAPSAPTPAPSVPSTPPTPAKATFALPSALTAPLVKECSDGNGRSCFLLGAFYSDSDLPAARRAYERGCELKTADACMVLGVALRTGEKFPRDLARAAALLERGCALGNGTACSAFAVGMLEGPTPVHKRYVAFMKAKCDAGIGECCTMLGALVSDGARGVGPPKRDEGRALIARGCRLGHAVACEALKTL